MSDETTPTTETAVVPRVPQPPPVPANGAPPTTPMMMIAHAMQSGASLEQLDKLLDLQQRFEANEARKAFTSAMAAFKANPPRIVKDREVNAGGPRYKHASLGNVCASINAALAEHGLSAGWNIKQEQAWVSVTCTLTHKDGHSESVEMGGPPDDSGRKNPIQQIASTVSYLERYTLLAITGMATHDMDDDGTKGGGDRLRDQMDQGRRQPSSEDPAPPAADDNRMTADQKKRLIEAGTWHKQRGHEEQCDKIRKLLTSGRATKGAAGALIGAYKKALKKAEEEAKENENQDVDPETGEVRGDDPI